MLLEELRSPTGKNYLFIHRPAREPWVYADWVGYPTANNVATGGVAYLDWMQKEQLSAVLNDNRHLVGRWDSSLEWLEKNWIPHTMRGGLRHWAHLDKPDAMSAASAAALKKLIAGRFEVELFDSEAAAQAWLRSRASR